MSRSIIVPRRRFNPADRIVLPQGRIVTCKGVTSEGYLMQPFGSEITDHISFVDFEAARRHPDYRYDAMYYTDDRARSRARVRIESNDQIPAEELPNVRWREACVLGFRDAKKKFGRTPAPDSQQCVNHTPEGCREAMRIAGPALMQLSVAHKAVKVTLTKTGKVRKVRAGQVIEYRSLPGPKALMNWNKAYERAGCQAWGLRQCHCYSGNTEPRDEPDEYVPFSKAIDDFLDKKRHSRQECYQKYVDDLVLINETRAEQNLPPLRTIGFTTYRKRLSEIPNFKRDAARHGEDYAVRKWGASKRSFEVTQIGEQVQIDGCKVSLMSWSVESGIWGTLTPEQKAVVPRARWILLRAIDLASRCLLAEILAPTETTEAAIALLRMMLEDKTPLAKAMGATTPWEYACVPAAISTDAGSAFRSDRFRQVLADLRIHFLAPEVGKPNKRAHVERSFGTTRTQLLSHFTGQTFANIQDRGDYDHVAGTSLFIDELARALVIYDVDVYHNSPHEGLMGETPRNAWHRLNRESGCSESGLGAHQQRGIFGIPLKRTLSKRGVRLLGLHYQSPDVAALFAAKGAVDVHLRADPQDLGWISVQIGSSWMSVPCATSGLNGVAIAAWQRVIDELRERRREQGAAGRAIAAEALRKIRKIAENAEIRMRIEPTIYNPELIAALERENLRGFDIPDDLVRIDHGPIVDPLGRGVPVTGAQFKEAGAEERRQPRAPSSDVVQQRPPDHEDDEGTWSMETPDA